MDPNLQNLVQQRFRQCVEKLGGDGAKSDNAFAPVWNAGRQACRKFHDINHFYEVAGKNKPAHPSAMQAIRYMAGMYHDVVYRQVDSRTHASGFTPEILATLDKYLVQQNGTYVLREDLPEQNRLLYQAAVEIFTPPGQPLKVTNEFLSALYGMENAKSLGIADKHILAMMAHIEATLPFGPPDHFDKLEVRLRKANELLPSSQQLSEREIESTMKSAAHTANVDVIGFRQKFSVFMNKTYDLTYEMCGGKEALDNPDTMLRACMGQTGFLEDCVLKNPQARVYHSAYSEPADFKLQTHERRAEQNIRVMGEYMRANAVTASLVTALHISQHQSAPEIQDISLNSLLRRNFRLYPEPEGLLNEAGEIALTQMKKQTLVTDEVAAYLMESMGSDVIHKLGNLANETGICPDPAKGKPGIATPETAKAFLNKVKALCKEENIDYSIISETLSTVMQADIMPVHAVKFRRPAAMHSQAACR